MSKTELDIYYKVAEDCLSKESGTGDMLTTSSFAERCTLLGLKIPSMYTLRFLALPYPENTGDNIWKLVNYNLRKLN